jgi:hypothetical protein
MTQFHIVSCGALLVAKLFIAIALPAYKKRLAALLANPANRP